MAVIETTPLRAPRYSCRNGLHSCFAIAAAILLLLLAAGRRGGRGGRTSGGSRGPGRETAAGGQ
ncbi:hypothetical protein CHLRE_02g100566v5 [Chlamydomonas reinhardtii]|uniref:Uncharacterized protein n=1 Tax=Chlamydomonas reinhardtii TaxID=3055 RepID=A0A2K3E2A0_CHLRE|nr:uncharacterized protein CHLRE_02g100566v5 [Chlamydomonas reinhardtii]PNW86902.1 hypothetical protein CHLRE_02g100566v5 [Chlamydomonas reinhardtii]